MRNYIEMDKHLGELYCADTADDLGAALDHLIGLLLDLEMDEWSSALAHMLDSMRDHVDVRVAQMLAAGFACCPPPLATLRYLSMEIRSENEPRWTIAQIEYFRDLIVNCDSDLVRRSYDVARQVMEYLDGHYQVFSTMYCVLGVPYTDINCVAQGIIGPDIREMVVNASDDEDQVISMAFDFAAQTIADDELPAEAIDLLKATSAPTILQMTNDEQITAYTDALATGLAYGSTYADVISYDAQWASDWHVYVKEIMHGRTKR